MFRFRRFLPLVAAALLVASLLSAPTQARASFSISVFVDGVAATVTGPLGNPGTNGSDPNDFYAIGSVPFFSVNIDSMTNHPGSASTANMSDTTNSQIKTAFGAAGGTHTLTIVISENFWLSPTSSPLLLSSSAGGSASSNGGSLVVAATNQGFLDNLNTLATTIAPGGIGTPIASAAASPSGTATLPLVYTPSPSVVLVPGGVPFTLTEVFTFSFTVAPGSGQQTANVSGTVNASSVPAPAGLVLALAGLPWVGLGEWLRRRRRARLAV